MSTHIPKDIEKNGGWEFDVDFEAKPVKEGQIWRKCGPVDALKIKDVNFENGNGIKGISVVSTHFKHTRVSWGMESYFIPAQNEKSLHNFLKGNGYALAKAVS